MFNNNFVKQPAFAELYYDFIDVNSNIERAEYIARRIGNGLHAALNFAVMLVLLAFAIGLAWHFDFHSTYDAMKGLITEVVKGLPLWLVPREKNGDVAVAGATIVAIFTGVITVAPTLMELFTANLARANIIVIKTFVLGFSAFDVITDIPTTKAWIDTWQPSFDALGPILGWAAHWVAFFLWLVMATVGFQLSVVIFGYLAVIYFKKMTVGGVVSRDGPFAQQVKKVNIPQQQQQQKQPQQQPQQGQPVKVQKVTVEAAGAEE